VRETRLIAVVDDDAIVRTAIEALVQSLGYPTVSFQSAEDFLSSRRVEDIACLVTDVRMPGKSGLELHQQLLADGHRTPVIFMTAFQHEFRERCLAAGAAGFLTKPIRDESLIKCLDLAFSRLRADIDRPEV
jgi:FixJ family two-component response regulator